MPKMTLNGISCLDLWTCVYRQCRADYLLQSVTGSNMGREANTEMVNVVDT